MWPFRSHAEGVTADSASVLTAAACFTQAPFEVLPIIDNNTRLDMLDYFRAGSDRASANMLGGPAKITHEDASTITFDYGSGASMQIFVLNADSPKPLIGVIETVSSPIQDSSLTIYDSRWERQPLAPEPVLAQWMASKAGADRRIVEEALPYIMATCSYDPATGALTIKHTMDGYFALGEGDKALSLIKPELRYKWTGRQFKPEK